MSKLLSVAAFLATVLSMATQAGATEEEVRKALSDYVAAFNKQDLPAVAAMWSENATHVDRESGRRTEGRAAIQADLATAFKDQPESKLAGRVDRVRMIKPDVASVEGETTYGAAEEDPTVNAFSAILINQDGKWLIDSIEEMPLATPATPQDALAELEWLVGAWVDEGEGTRVESNIRWTANNAFLLRSYTATSDDGATQQGTQIIAWDPRSKEIRSWSFNSDGSFGDAVWSRHGDEWLIKSSQTLADGDAASGTYVLKRIDDATMSMELVGHEIEGEPQPSKPAVKIARATPPAPAAPPATGARAR